MPKKNATKRRVKRSDLPSFAYQVAEALKADGRFVLWLHGEMGAGKTTIAGELLHAIGLPAHVPVLSPTFTFMTEYETPLGLVAHLDLYRLAIGDDDAVETLLANRNFAGLIVEWPERTPGAPSIISTHTIKIEFADDLEERDVEFMIG
jgi:tRNA threonylcarbamoyl adenosine modification protein YjeE